MKYLFLIAGFLLFSDLSAQQAKAVNQQPIPPPTSCRSSFERVELRSGNNPETIRQYLRAHLNAFKDERCDVKLNYRHESLSGYHYSFSQTFSGVPIYQSEIKVNTDKRNTILCVFDNSYSTANWGLDIPAVKENAIIALHPATGEPVLGLLKYTDNFKEVIEAAGQVIHERDTRMFFAAPDSTVSGKVFNPDPLTTAGQLYDTNTVYKHNNNANAPWIESQLQTVNFKANFDGIRFKLESPYVIISDFDTPNVAPATSTLPQFYYSRPNTGLEDVNAFYHANRFRDYINGMGFDCANVRVSLDAHAAYGADQSFYSPNNSPPRIYFGTGGVPDAQDADVIIHEYAHFLSDNASPLSNIGYERTALDEAFGDYIAASYSRSLNTFKDEWVFNWDGHNEFWNGRVVNAYKFYPQNLTFNSIYRDGEIFSSTLFQLNGDIGRGVMDSLIIEAHYNYAQNMKMTDAAQLLIMVDSIQHNGAHYCAIYKRLYERGLMPYRTNPCGISSVEDITNSTGGFRMTQNGTLFELFTPEEINEPVTIEIYSMTGNRLAAVPVRFSSGHSFIYQNPDLASGMYAVRVHSSSVAGSFRWVKINP